MHQYSMAREVVETVADDARRRCIDRIVSVCLETGEMSQADRQCLQAAFTLARSGTVLSEAELILQCTPGRLPEILQYEGERADE
jgi:hydrogenase nickel incorporation protein HypA/HybF